MAEMFFRKKVLLAETESTYGTDPTPTAADAIVTRNLSIEPYAGPTVQKNIDRAALGGYQQINVAPRVLVTFDVYWAASGDDVDTPPNWNKIIQACGFNETITATTECEYDPVSSAFDSVTMYFYHDGDRHIITGARGNVSLNVQAGELPYFSFTFTGIWNAPTSTPLVTGAPVNEGDVLAVTNTNTPTFSLQGYANGPLVGMTIDMNNEIAVENIPNKNGVDIVNRAATGSISLIEENISDQNWYTAVRSDNGVVTGALSLVHGTAANNILEVDAPAVQLSNPQKGERNGLATITFDASFLPTASENDEVTFTSR